MISQKLAKIAELKAIEEVLEFQKKKRDFNHLMQSNLSVSVENAKVRYALLYV